MSSHSLSPASDGRLLVQSSRPGSIASIDSVMNQSLEGKTGHGLPRTQSETTLVNAHRPARVSRPVSTPSVRTYMGYNTEDAYLASLIEFGRSKGYVESDNQLIGFYGKKTMDECIEQGSGWRNETKQQRAARKQERARRKGEAIPINRRATLPALTEEDNVGITEPAPAVRLAPSSTAEPPARGLRRISQGFSRAFSRRGTVA